MLPKLFSTTQKYLIGGAIFGLCFPLFSTLIWSIKNNISFIDAQVSNGNILIWVIDTAPLVLGFVFYILGRKAETLEQLNLSCEQEIKEKTQELSIKNEELEAIFSAFPDILFRISNDGVILDYKTGSSNKLYVQPSVFLGKKMKDILPAHLADQFMENHEKLKETKQINIMRYEMELPEGIRFFEARLIPFGDNEVLEIVRDISELKKIEEELLKSQSKAEQQKGMVSLITTYNHEINNPLAIAVSASTLIKKGKSTEEQVKVLDDALLRICDVVKKIGLIETADPEELNLKTYSEYSNQIHLETISNLKKK
jgi:PAS domain-containing protein